VGGREGGRQKVGNGDWLWRCIMCPVRAQCCWTNTRSRIKAEGRRGEERGGGGGRKGGGRERDLCAALDHVSSIAHELGDYKKDAHEFENGAKHVGPLKYIVTSGGGDIA